MSIGDCPYWPDCGHRGASGMRACDGTERDERMEAAFTADMDGRQYGREETQDARAWFASGWYAAHRKHGPQCAYAQMAEDLKDVAYSPATMAQMVTGTGAPPPQRSAITPGRTLVVVRLEEHSGE